MEELLSKPAMEVYNSLLKQGMTAHERSLCMEAARIKHRLDRFEAMLLGEDTEWVSIVDQKRNRTISLRVDDVLRESRQTATVYRQLIEQINNLAISQNDSFEDGDVLDDL